MTTLRFDTLTDQRAPESRSETMRISWSIARGAIAGMPTITSSAREHILTLEAVLRPDHSIDSVRITVDGHAAPGADTAHGVGGWMRDEHGLMHVRIFEPRSDTPLADLTVDTESGSPKVLYARTTILHSLGIPGGRYELCGIELRSEHAQ
ncbi:MAG: hypothetical protein ACK54H_07140 [Phycisphaerales bacterium]